MDNKYIVDCHMHVLTKDEFNLYKKTACASKYINIRGLYIDEMLDPYNFEEFMDNDNMYFIDSVDLDNLDNELVKSEAYTLDGTKITDLPNFHAIDFVSDDISIIFAQSDYVNISTGVPIVEADVPTKAGISRFVVSPDSSLNGAEIALSIELVNVSIDDELKCNDFKIQLLENNSVIYNGTGSSVTSDTLVLKEVTKLTNLNSVNYELRIWINETGVSQNNLMGKSFSGKIKISTSIKK